MTVLRKATTDISERKTEAALVRTYLKYQTKDQFCYVCENGHHKASDCELLVKKVIKDKPQKEKLCSQCNGPKPKVTFECLCNSRNVHTPPTLIKAYKLAIEFNLMEVKNEKKEAEQDSSNPTDKMRHNQTPTQSWNEDGNVQQNMEMEVIGMKVRLKIKIRFKT